jgi:OOP family OmpA-OmpF porin
MLKIYLIALSILACSFLSEATRAQDVQWASELLSFSSQFSVKEYSAAQVLGKPNKCPSSGDSPCAWLPKSDGRFGGGEEHIKVGYAKPMAIQQVGIAENSSPGAVQQVILYDLQDKPHRVYYGDPAASGQQSRIMHVFFVKTDYKVKAVELVLQCGKVPGYNEIDAIGISDSKTPIEAKINLAANSKISGSKENLGYNINSQFDEVFPVISPDGKTLYFDRKDHPANIGRTDNIWYSELLSDGKWGPAINIGSPLNIGGISFVASVTPDGNTLLIGGTYPDDDERLSFGLCTSNRTGGGWSKPQKMKIDNFFTKHRFMEFCLANDGKTMIASLQRDDSYGVRDLYVSFLKDDGSWSAPKNLGSDVNSASDEGMPFLASDGKTMYFSSEGFAGYGSVDMFMTRRLDDSWTKWSEPVNLGPDFNTPDWDAYYTVPASGDYAYFVSNKGSVGGLDIFRAKLPQALKPEPVVLVYGKAIDSKTGHPLSAEIHYEILPGGKEAGIARTNPKDGSYKITLPAGHLYGFRAEAKGYIPVSENLDVKKIDTYKEINRDLKLVPFASGETVRLNNIFFDFNKSELKSESFSELDRLVQMLKDKSDVEVTISGHTDNVGKPAANQKLSEARAAAVKAYLGTKGIILNRLKVVGYGSTKPLAPNSTEDGRQQNRRVEFTIK